MVHVGRQGRVRCEAVIPLALPAGSVWGQLRDFHRFAAHDYFHADIQVEGGVPQAGARLRLSHRYAGFHVVRVGRILWWREGEGFAFSDLSVKGPQHGFPHVFVLRVEAIDHDHSKLHVVVRGKWTAMWVPPWARWAWLSWVFAYVVSRTRNELLAFCLARDAAASKTARAPVM